MDLLLVLAGHVRHEVDRAEPLGACDGAIGQREVAVAGRVPVDDELGRLPFGRAPQLEAAVEEAARYPIPRSERYRDLEGVPLVRQEIEASGRGRDRLRLVALLVESRIQASLRHRVLHLPIQGIGLPGRGYLFIETAVDAAFVVGDRETMRAVHQDYDFDLLARSVHMPVGISGIDPGWNIARRDQRELGPGRLTPGIEEQRIEKRFLEALSPLDVEGTVGAKEHGAVIRPFAGPVAA